MCLARQCAGGADIDGGQQLKRAIVRHAFAGGHPEERNAFGNEVADPALKAHAHPVALCEGAETRDVDISDVARRPAQNSKIEGRRHGAIPFRHVHRPARIGHQLVDHEFGLAPNAVMMVFTLMATEMW